MSNIRIDLPQAGDGFFVEIKSPNKLSWKDQKSITSAFKDGSDISSQLDVAERIAISLVKSGYVLDEDNKPIEYPLTAETVGDVPAVAIEAVMKAFADAKKEASGKNS